MGGIANQSFSIFLKTTILSAMAFSKMKCFSLYVLMQCLSRGLGAQLVEVSSTHQKVEGSIPSWGTHRRQPIHVSLVCLSLSKNQ